MTRSVVVGTAGHIDHGKSALVRALTGIDPDRLKEEKARGITIDLGFAHWTTPAINLAFIDVPGHERFVKNMLAGVGGIDLVLLVIAADESVMPQTREHFDICRLLHVPHGLIALTKRDLVDPETLELVALEAKDLVAGSFLDGAPIVPVSSTTGEGLDALAEALLSLGRAVAGRPASGPARLPIDRAFSVKGFGTVVTGTLLSGRIAIDQELRLLPADRPAKVRGLEVHGRRQTDAAAGHRVAVNLGGVDLVEVARGASLVAPGAFEPTRTLDAALELLPGARALRHGARVRFHHGTCEVLGRILVAAPAAGAPAEIRPGRRAWVRIRLESPAVLTRGDRFIIRAYSPPVTIGGGQVLDPQPPRAGVRTAAAAHRFAALDGETAPQANAAEDRAVALMVEENGPAGLRCATLTSRAGVPSSLVAELVGRLEREHGIVSIGDLLVSRAALADLHDRLLAALADHHRSQPLAEGLPREEARVRLFARAGAGVFEHVVADLVSARAITSRDVLALATHRLALSDEEQEARAAIERAFRGGGLAPPDASALAVATGLRPDLMDRMLKLLLRQKILVKVDALLFHEEALRRLKEEMAALKATALGGPPKIDVAAFKERYGVTRKFAIPLLEYLDRERVTRRVGDSRLVL